MKHKHQNDEAKADHGDHASEIDKETYRSQLRSLQVELVKLQRHLIENQGKTLIIFEGRDAAGKDGTIKRIVDHLSPRDTRIVALGKPSERDRSSWYFQRYIAHLPAAEEMALFNRSWYNRAGVERVMGFCTEEQVDEFFSTVVNFEHMLIRSGIKLLKFYLDISKDEQRRRLDERRENPLKQWKISPIDRVAIEHWDQYSTARNEMLSRTHNLISPWHIVRANNKRLARLNVIRTILAEHDYRDKELALLDTQSDIVFQYDKSYLDQGLISS